MLMLTYIISNYQSCDMSAQVKDNVTLKSMATQIHSVILRSVCEAVLEQKCHGFNMKK